MDYLETSTPPHLQCCICNRKFLDPKLLEKHILTHIGAAPYCSICKAVFITPWQLHSHLLIDHKVSSKIEQLSGNPECDDCMLYHGPELAFHYAHHIKQMSYNCEMCNLSFCNEKDIIIHSHLHKPDAEMNCEVCGKTFQKKLKCLLHVVTHNNHVLFQHFPNCELSDCALEVINSLSSIKNNENILNSSDNNFLGVFNREKNIPALNLEENISSNEISCDSGFKIPKLSIYVPKSLGPWGPTKNQFKTTKGINVNMCVPKSLWSYGHTKKISSLLKKFDSYIWNDDLKSVYLYSFEIVEPHTEPIKDHMEKKGGSKLEIFHCSKKPCIKLHRLSNNIFSLYMNNQPIILKKDISQETLNNADQLGDCSNVIEFNLESYAHVEDNNYLESDNLIIEDDHENSESVQSCESNTNIFSHSEQVQLRDVSVKLYRLPDNTATFHLKSILSDKGKDNVINLCEKSNSKKKYVDKGKIKSHAKKSEKKENTICRGIPKKTQKNKIVKLMLRKKRVLLEKYVKSLLWTQRMKNFLLNISYSELADTLEKLRKKSKNAVDEEFVSFVRRITNSENFSKQVKTKKCPPSKWMPLKNFKSSRREKDDNVCSNCLTKKLNIYVGHQVVEENPSIINPSNSCDIPDEIAELHESVDHHSVGCSTNIKEIQNHAANKNIGNMTKKSQAEDGNGPRSKKQVTNISTLAKVNECSGLLNIVKTALKQRQNKKKQE
ncbi:Zinc finger protein 324B, partial [Stegodyphus mimosarum]